MQRTKRQKSAFVNEKTLIVAIDIGRTANWCYMRAPGNREKAPFSFSNTRNGFKIFWDRLQTFKQMHRPERVVVGFESTGSYAEPLIHFLHKKPVNLTQVNPMHTKRLKELTGNSPNKTDQKDPRVIADVISLNHGLTVIIPQGAAADLRRLIHARERVTCDLTAKSNQLQQLVYIVFPEFYTLMKKALSKSALYVLKHSPLPEDIMHIGEKRLAGVLRKISRGRLGLDRSRELIEAARHSVGIDQGVRSIALEIKYLVETIESTQRFIDFLETDIENHLHSIPYSRNILSIKGVGLITAAGLIGETGDIRAYTTTKELEKLAGLDLYEISSGKHKGMRRITKRGRSLMRKILYCAALNMVKTNGIMYHPYHRMLNRGMPNVKALVAISRKLLRLIFALVRDNTMFEISHVCVTSIKKVA